MAKAKRRGKHIPQRTCIACRQKKDKRLLTRIVKTPDNGVIVDPSGKKNGRGAYLCDLAKCWTKAVDNNLLDEALKVKLSEAERQRILEQSPVLPNS